MMKTIEALYACVSPSSAARILNPIRSEYYLKDNSPAPAASSQAVKVTLSAEAQAAMKAS